MMNMQMMDVVDRILNALTNDPRTKDAKIEVANERGIVTLNGTVAQENIRQAAEEIAKQQQGVITVIDEIKVK